MALRLTGIASRANGSVGAATVTETAAIKAVTKESESESFILLNVRRVWSRDEGAKEQTSTLVADLPLYEGCSPCPLTLGQRCYSQRPLTVLLPSLK